MTHFQEYPSILVIDDSPHNRASIIREIHSLIQGAQIDEADNGEVAIDLVNHFIEENGKNYDVIFMDFEMPFLNGQETTFAIRKLEQSLQQKSFIITWSSAKTEPLEQTDSVMPKPTVITKLEEIFLDQGYLIRQ